MDNVAGVKIPKFEQILEGADSKMSLTGLSKGGKAIQVRARPGLGTVSSAWLAGLTTVLPDGTVHQLTCCRRRPSTVQGCLCKNGMAYSAHLIRPHTARPA